MYIYNKCIYIYVYTYILHFTAFIWASSTQKPQSTQLMQRSDVQVFIQVPLWSKHSYGSRYDELGYLYELYRDLIDENKYDSYIRWSKFYSSV